MQPTKPRSSKERQRPKPPQGSGWLRCDGDIAAGALGQWPTLRLSSLAP